MLLEIILFLFLGIMTGIFTGLVPGIHINLVGGIIVSLTALIFYQINPIYTAVFIVAMAITHTFLDFIPSVFMGCPDTDTELSVLPGHDLLKQGLGYEAVLLTCYGSLAAVFVLAVIFLPSIIIVEKSYPFIENIIPFILITVSLILILSEKKKLSALLAFTLSGILGFSVLNLVENSDRFLLPLLTGLFGSSMMIISIKNKIEIPKQFISKPKTKILRPLMGSVIAAPFCSFLPGLGSGQAAIIGNMISKSDSKGFLVLLGATNTLVMGFSFITLYLIGRTRTGAAVSLNETLRGFLSFEVLVFLMAIILLSGIISFFIAIFIARFFSEKISTLDYQNLSILIILILAVLTLNFSGFLGLIIFGISTLTGIYVISLNVRRTNMMGCLIIPTIIFYLFGF